MNLTDINKIKELLSPYGFSFKKSLGQNFLIDETVCPKIAENAANKDTGVLEIGPGIGVLTKELAKRSKKTVAVELDTRLKPVLEETLKEFDNVKIVFGDALKLDLQKLIKEEFSDCKRVTVAANLPYYITSPVIIKLLTENLPIEKIVVMVQKEAAERICAPIGSREAGVISVAVSYRSQSEILFNVGKEAFFPSPNVNSAVIALNILKEPPVNVENEEKFFKLVKAGFNERRKTLANSLFNTLKIDKETVYSALESIGLDRNIRCEKLTLSDFANLESILDIRL